MSKEIKKQDAIRLMITMATSYQGDHSSTGAEVAELLGISFPLTMKNLSKAAKEHKLDPDVLWPWLKPMKIQSHIQPRFGGSGTLG